MEKTRKPGTRQFECVRRAWHSDRHQPMRGSIIQQIFKLVNETHGPATRKNREWQEKLPVVVLKAEEIMYSKANSEAEYINQDTLWDRLNDAVDTIIRRDESTETGQFLQPCIEAALVLGCVPVKASRSQRCNIRNYLTPRAQDLPTAASVAPAAPIASENANDQRLTPTPEPSSHPCYQKSMPMQSVSNQPKFTSKSDGPCVTAAHKVPMLHTNVLCGVVTSVPYESSTSKNFSSVYPLYYGTHARTPEPQISLQLRQNSNPNNVFIGTPVCCWSHGEPAHVGTARNLLPGDNVANTGEKLRQGNTHEGHAVKASDIDCDLSLRLGPSSGTRSLAYEIGDGGTSSSCNEGGRFFASGSSNREFCFFPPRDAIDPSESCLGRLAAEGEVEDAAALRKRKAPMYQVDDDSYASLWQDSRSNQFHGGIRWRGL